MDPKVNGQLQHDWSWLIAVYLFLGGVGGGAYTIAAINSFLGTGLEPVVMVPPPESPQTTFRTAVRQNVEFSRRAASPTAAPILSPGGAAVDHPRGSPGFGFSGRGQDTSSGANCRPRRRKPASPTRNRSGLGRGRTRSRALATSNGWPRPCIA